MGGVVWISVAEREAIDCGNSMAERYAKVLRDDLPHCSNMRKIVIEL